MINFGRGEKTPAEVKMAVDSRFRGQPASMYPVRPRYLFHSISPIDVVHHVLHCMQGWPKFARACKAMAPDPYNWVTPKQAGNKTYYPGGHYADGVHLHPQQGWCLR